MSAGTEDSANADSAQAPGASHGIGDLAKAFDVTPRTIRFYEDRGLLSPRRIGQTRVYSNRDQVRLKLILRGKRLGFSLDEISDMLGLYDAPDGELGQIQYLLRKIRERRTALLAQRNDIDVTLAELESVETRCAQALLGKAAP